jgi:hypothetical protein
MLVKVLPRVFEHLKAGAQFYEKTQPGLGEYFLSTIYADIDSLSLLAGIHVKQFGFYRLLASKFSCAIYYDIIDGVSVVSAVLDTRRNPVWVKEYLDKF